MNKKWGLVVIAVALLTALKLCNNDNEAVSLFSPEPEPRMRFGLYWDSLNIDSGSIKSGQTLSHLLDPMVLRLARLQHLQQIVRTFTRLLQ